MPVLPSDFEGLTNDEFLSTMATAITDAEKISSIPRIPDEQYSVIGATNGGSTVAAGTTQPALAGEIIISAMGGVTWVKITGTAVDDPDNWQIYATFEGLRLFDDDNPSAFTSHVTAAVQGADGLPALNTGEIVVSLGVASMNKIRWFLVQRVAPTP